MISAFAVSSLNAKSRSQFSQTDREWNWLEPVFTNVARLLCEIHGCLGPGMSQAVGYLLCHCITSLSKLMPLPLFNFHVLEPKTYSVSGRKKFTSTALLLAKIPSEISSLGWVFTCTVHSCVLRGTFFNCQTTQREATYMYGIESFYCVIINAE